MEFYLFDRKDKLIHFDDLSLCTPERLVQGKIDCTMSQNEVYVIQLAAVSREPDTLRCVEVQGDATVACINTDRTDKWGDPSPVAVALKPNEMQPLFFTVEVAQDGPRTVESTVVLTADSGVYPLHLTLQVTDEPVVNRGYNDLWRLSRLKWLNSTLAQDETLVKPFTPPVLEGNTVSILGRKIQIGENGLPTQIVSYYDQAIDLCDTPQLELLAAPGRFAIGEEVLPPLEHQCRVHNNRVCYLGKCQTERYAATVAAVYRYQGQVEYRVTVTPKVDFSVSRVALQFALQPEATALMHGLGYRAGKAAELDFTWNADKQQDCLFMGAVNGGMRIKWKAENYRRPLVNIFYKNLPLQVPDTTWDNGGKGSVQVRCNENGATVTAATGAYDFKAGESRHFDFELQLTPFKPLDHQKMFGVRYDHNSSLKDAKAEIDEAAANGLNYVTFHQGNYIMPFINYPFYEVPALQEAVRYAAKKGIGIKLYYTEREHSNHMAETFVYKALGDEIILRKQGVSHSWQKEKPQWLVDNFGEDIIPGWFVKYTSGKYKDDHDISFIVRPDTRLDNYYVEGLQWLVQNVGIKGIYIDDTSLDRTTIERAKKILDPIDGLIDMHMWNHEEERAGDVSCLNLYAEILPFLDSIWLGEGFYYKKYTPEYMLAEVSGIPYGVPGQMLQDGGDPYCGMLYGMNNRYGWGYRNATDIYKIWDDFGIADSAMRGYWHKDCPVHTDCGDVQATVYVKEKTALVCIYNFSKYWTKCRLQIDTGKLGFVPKRATTVPIGKKRSKTVKTDKPLRLKGRGGKFILLEG